MAHTIETNLAGAAGTRAKLSRAVAVVRGRLVKMLVLLSIWQDRAEQRRTLAELNERMLKDIGVSYGDAYKEARKPFWLP